MKIQIGSEQASRVRGVLRDLVRDLASTIESPRYSDTAGLAEAIADVLVAIREMDLALPDHESDPVVEPPSLDALRQPQSGCSVPIRLPLDSARDLVVMAMAHSRSLDRLIPEVLKTIPDELRKPTVRRFGEVMGRLYTEIMHPLHEQHQELKPLVLGKHAR